MNTTKLYCEIDDFSKAHQDQCKKHNTLTDSKKKERESRLNVRKIATILLEFHFSGAKIFRLYYLGLMAAPAHYPPPALTRIRVYKHLERVVWRKRSSQRIRVA